MPDRKSRPVIDAQKEELELKIDGFAAGSLPSANRRQTAPASMPGTTVGRSQTHRAVAQHARLTPEAARMLEQIHRRGPRDPNPPQFTDDGGGLQGQPDEVTARNLPAVIQSAIVRSDETLQPRWNMVRNLPGYMQSPIRGFGRAIFSAFTDTPIEDIQIVSTLSNSETETKALMIWIAHNGRRNDVAELHFEEVMPGFTADVQLWQVENCSFMLVRDMMGHYVYGWPGDCEPKLQHHNAPRLR